MSREAQERGTSVKIVLLVLCAVAWLSACDFGDPGPRGEVGVTSSAGSVLVRVHPCDSDALVESVALTASTGQAGQEGEVLWEIRAERGSSILNYEMGKVATGFVETVPPTDIERDTRYVAKVTLTSETLPLLVSFVPSMLEESMWHLSAGRSVDEEQFQSLSPCK